MVWSGYLTGECLHLLVILHCRLGGWGMGRNDGKQPDQKPDGQACGRTKIANRKQRSTQQEV